MTSAFRRTMTNRLALGASTLCALAVVVPLILIFYHTLAEGIGALTPSFFVNMPKPVGEEGGGMANALAGTGILLGLGALFGIPLGIATGIYLAEYGVNAFGSSLRFLVNVLAGVPSIVVGVVAYALVVVPMRHYSALAGGIALGLLIIPSVTLTTEKMILMVPQSFREAGLALGIERWKTTLRIITPAAMKGITTGMLLALARAAGETAPLLFTSLGNRFWSTSVGEPIAALTVFMYDYAKAPFEDWNRQAWAAGFVLIAFISILSVIFRIVTRSRYADR